MNVKTVVVLLIVALVVFFSLKSLWKYLKGEKGCGCAGGSCCGGGSHHEHGAGGCSCKK